MCRRTQEQLNKLFENNGLKWVRAQLYTDGGEINRLESPYAKVWVEDQKERLRKREKREERLWNLLFLLIGAAISALVVWNITKVQLDSMEKQHIATIQQQEDSIRETFENGYRLMLLQYKTESELRFLKDIYASIEDDFEPLFPEIHAMRNNWKEQLVTMGKTTYLQKLAAIRYQISEAIKKFDKLLKKNSHHKEIYDEFYSSMSFQSKYSNPITDLRVDIERFPNNFTVGNLQVLNSRGEKFSEAVNVLHEWIENTKKLAQDRQREIYKLRQENINNK
ncbi:MAG: hypothetical protein ABIE75_02035 [Candidatus Omnitrophota bacterium]